MNKKEESNRSELIVSAMKARVELCNLEAHSPETAVDNTTHSANASVSIIMNRDAISNGLLMSGYDFYFREVTIRIVNQAAKILGKDSIDHNILADVAESTQAFMRRVFGHEKYRDLLSAPNDTGSMADADKCVMLSVYFAIQDGMLCWVAYTNSMQRDPEDGFSYKVIDLIEDWNDVEKELQAGENQGIGFPNKFTVPLLRVNNTGPSGNYYSEETLNEAIKLFVSKKQKGGKVYGELRSVVDNPSDDRDMTQVKKVNLDYVSHEVNELFFRDGMFMANIETVSGEHGGALALVMQAVTKEKNFPAKISEVMSFGIRGSCTTKIIDGVKHVSNLDIHCVDAIYDMTKDSMKLKAEE